MSSSSLLSFTNYMNSNIPDLTGIVTGFFETPSEFDDGYGERVRGLIVPPLTGTYVFWAAADDQGLVYLSSDESPYNKVPIVFAVNNLARAWYSAPAQQSTNIFLEAGKRYYIEGLHSAGTGDDVFAVGWKLPDGTLEQPVPTTRLYPYGVTATAAPTIIAGLTNVTVMENSAATFHLGVNSLDAVAYHWRRTLPGGSLTPIGVLGASFTIPSATTNESGSRYQCIASNNLGTATSAEVTLTVLPDTTAPTLFTVANIDARTIEVVFSEPLEPASGTNISRYSLNGGIVVTAAAFTAGSGGRAVRLTTTPLTMGNSYTLTVTNVRDRAAAANVIPAGSQQSFTALVKGIYREVFRNIASSEVSDLTNSPAFPNNPTTAELLSDVFETPGRQMNNYGQRLRAKILPPVTGNYRFWVAADDSAVLLLGTNANPESARQICSVTTSVGICPQQWDVQTNQRSALISLVAGQQYYIEALMQTALYVEFPPDHLAVRWQLPNGLSEGPIPAARLTPYGMSLPTVSQQPTNTTVIEGGTATFTVAVSNLDLVTYQWHQNGIEIPGATNAIYTDTLVELSESNSVVHCAVSNALGAVNSSMAVLTVNPDVVRPTVVSAINNGSNRVVVVFSEPVDPVSATVPTNYTVTASTVSSVVTNDDRSVTLTITPLLTMGLTYNVTARNVSDRAATPNTMVSSARSFVAADFFPQDIGSPGTAGTSTPTTGGINVTASGLGVSGVSDQFHYSYQQRRGDFDVRVRVQRLDYNDPWSSAGLMVRTNLSTNMPFAGVFATPSIVGSFFQYRTNVGAMAETTGTFPGNYPFTWLRLQKTNGTTFRGFASYDGQTWTQLGSVTLNFPNTIFLGFAVSSHDPLRPVVVQFRDYADVPAGQGTIGQLPIDREPLGPSSRRTGLAFTEIMYHPAERTDGRSLEFIELFNSNPFAEDISGYRLSGQIDYTFPPGTILQGGAFIVVARRPADITAIYGISNVVGPYIGTFANDNGTVRLRRLPPEGKAPGGDDPVLLEVEYDSRTPWPASADGSGHSLVLARPSYGENNPRAWDQSDAFGGSPGRMDGVRYEPLRNVVINEFLAHTDLPQLDFIELYNHSTNSINLTGCWLSDTPATNRFRIPNGTIIGPTSFVYFTETTLGFALGSGGEGIYFFSSNRTYLIDSIRFEAQENGVSSGRYPDGAGGLLTGRGTGLSSADVFQRLATPTPGGRNAPLRADNIVINEIMYNPITDDDNDEYVELYNRGSNAVNISGWRFTEGIDFVFPTNTVIAASNYLVVAKNTARLMSNYAGLTNIIGNYDGTLRNSGERIVIAMPDPEVTTNAGIVRTNINYIPMDDVAYGTAGRGERWGRWNDGGGSSLELVDPRSDNRLPSNWADSDDVSKSVFTTVSINGPFDNVPETDSDWNALQIYLLDDGECLVDDISLTIPAVGGGNLVRNPGFEPNLTNWVVQGNHSASRLEQPGSLTSSRALRILASGRGDTGANRVHTVVSLPYDTNMTGTISAKVKWLHGTPELLIRVRGNHHEAPITMQVPKNLGTPGARNSRYITNAPPSIHSVSHNPVLPAASQPVVVTARIHDPDGLNSVQLHYRIDPVGSLTSIAMNDDGTGADAVPRDGLYAGTIPGQALNALVAFHITASDAYLPGPIASSRFPLPVLNTYGDRSIPLLTNSECLVRFGEAQPNSTYGTYRFWLTQASFNRWTVREKLSNEANEGTFVYGNFRVMYNAGAYYATSPFHSDGLSTPTGDNTDYQFVLPEDEIFLNTTEMRLQMPGNFGRDPTCQGEQTAYWMAEQLGQPGLYRRSVHMFVDGLKRGVVYEDTTKPNNDFEETWFPDSELGDMYKIMFWFEFDDSGENQSSIAPASLRNFTTTGGAKKLARYRQTFGKRAVKNSNNNYTNLFNLVDAVNSTATGDAYLNEVGRTVDFAQWARVFALERLLNNSDLYGNQKNSGNPGGQNAFLFKPEGDTWKFIIWDIDFAFSGLPTSHLFHFTDAPTSNMFSHPFILRSYWQALEDCVNGPFNPDKVYPRIDAKHLAYQTSGIEADPPDKIKNFIAVRREYVLWLLSQVRADFDITSNGGNNFTNPTTLVTLTGTAPISARTITINGIPYAFSWSSISNWTLQLPLTGQTNLFNLEAKDASGDTIAGGTNSITVYYNGPVGIPEENIVINEIMYRPGVSNASYVEIYNRSTNTTFGLLNYRLRGVDFDFAPGALLAPQSYLTLAKDYDAFLAAYGSGPALNVIGEFDGNLDPQGETLTLVRLPFTTNETEVVIDKVKYSAFAPWPIRPGLSNSAASLQLVDASRDNARVSDWEEGSSWRFVSHTATAGGNRLYFWLDGIGNVLIDDIRLVAGSTAAVGSNYVRNGDFETLFNTAWSRTGTGVDSTTNIYLGPGPYGTRWGSNSLQLVFTTSGVGGTSKCLFQDVAGVGSGTYTLSFWYKATTNANIVTARLGTSAFQVQTNVRPVMATPATANFVAGTVAPYPLLWINEVLPVNLNGLPDNTTTPQPWVELFNSGTNDLSLDGFYLANNYTNIAQWAFPPGLTVPAGQFRVFFVDGQPQLSTGTFIHASFRLDATNGAIVLSQLTDYGLRITDYINYTNLAANVSYGSYPDGQLFDRQHFYFVTPGASNNPAPIPVAINEWMASNTNTLLNPARSRYDDWFELYNFSSDTVDLSGYNLTDDPGNRRKYRIPNGTTIGPQSFLLCWADNDVSGTNTVGNALHANFALSRGSDEIALYSPDGMVLVDVVSFGDQNDDVSQGRFPDGNVAGVYYFMPTPTPRTNNVVTNNIYAPVLATIPDYTIPEGATLSFTATATDADFPQQTLTYSLVAGAPQGAMIGSVGGDFSWIPNESQGGTTYPITVKVFDNGDPALEDTKTFNVTVTEVNSAPTLTAVTNQSVNPGAALNVPMSASDPDLPAQTLSFSLLAGPSGASINSGSGLFTWTPSQAQASTTNVIVVVVADNGSPSLSATQSFTVIVGAGNACPQENAAGLPLLEGDVSPRPTGNGTNSLTDWVQVGRFAGGIDTNFTACEFQRFDCAPRPCGNGTNSLTDWIQAGRYYAGLDATNARCGPTERLDLPPQGGGGTAMAFGIEEQPLMSNGRAIIAAHTVIAHGESNWVQILLNALGDENGSQFSVSFESELLSYTSARLVGAASEGSIVVKTNELAFGRLGVSFVLGTGESFPPGLQPVVELRFRAHGVPNSGEPMQQTAITFGDQPVRREVGDVEADVVAADYENGLITITSELRITNYEPQTSKLVIVSPPGHVFEIEASTNLVHWESLGRITNVTGLTEFVETTPTTSTQRFYRARTQ